MSRRDGSPASADSVPAPPYRAPAAPARAELREKGSKFLAVLTPAAEEAEAKAVLASLAAEHRGATHHCYAWRLGPRPIERSSDAGEPAGTAGAPILAVLRGAEVSDVVAVVVRWYGGTKLGRGGLARAYAGATRAALAGLRFVQRVPTETVELEVPYDRLGAVKRLVQPPFVELVGERYGQVAVHLALSVHRERFAATSEALAALGVKSRK